MRFLKWISLGLGALVALAVLGVLVIVWFVDPNSFKSNIEAAVRDATGREITLAGDIELGFFPWLSLETGEGSFGNAPGFGPEPLVSWKRARVGARLLPLLRGRLIADRVMLEGADVRLVRRADGSANWQGIGSGKPADPNAEPMQIDIAGVEIRDSRLSLVDEGVPRRVEITALNLETDAIKPGNPFTDTEISGVLHMEGFAPEGLAFSLDVPRAAAPEDFSSLDVPAFEVKLGALEARGALQGDFGEALRLQGNVETNDFDPRVLLKTVGIEAPRTTDPKALGRVKLAATGAFEGGAIHIARLALGVDDTHFTGKFARGAGEEAIGEFELRGDRIAIARYVPPPDPDSEPFVLPTATLRALKFRGTLSFDEATFNDIAMKGVTLRLLLDEQGLRSVESAP